MDNIRNGIINNGVLYNIEHNHNNDDCVGCYFEHTDSNCYFCNAGINEIYKRLGKITSIEIEE